MNRKWWPLYFAGAVGAPAWLTAGVLLSLPDALAILAVLPASVAGYAALKGSSDER